MSIVDDLRVYHLDDAADVFEQMQKDLAEAHALIACHADKIEAILRASGPPIVRFVAPLIAMLFCPSK